MTVIKLVMDYCGWMDEILQIFKSTYYFELDSKGVKLNLQQ